MATLTWVGAPGSVFWATGTNWFGGIAPATTDSVLVNGVNSADILNGTSVTIASLDIEGVGAAGGTVIVGGSQEILPAANFPGVFTKNGGTLNVTGVLTVNSTINSGGLVGGINGVISAATMNVGANALIGGGGTFDVAGIITNLGAIVADGNKPGLGLGPVVVNATSVVGTGIFEVAGPSTLEINAATKQNIVVDPGSTATVQLDKPTTFTGGLSLGAGAHLDLMLSGQTPTAATISTAAQTLTITGAGGTLETIPFVSDTAATATIAGPGDVSLTAAAAPPTTTPPTVTPPTVGGPTVTPPTVTPPAVAGPTATPPDPATVLGAFDTSTNTTMVAVGDPYPGPVPGLLHQYINTTSDNINLTASSPGWFIHSGSGEDAIAANSGTNVLDGGTGSNFLTGGNGTDTFFVDNRGATADIWSTVVGFHSGDSATVWGVTPQDFALNFFDGQGAGGFTGLTLHATAAGKPTASLTLAGFTKADMSNGRLSVQFGTDQASGSAFMFIHGNS